MYIFILSLIVVSICLDMYTLVTYNWCAKASIFKIYYKMFSHRYIKQYSAYIWLISSIEYEIDCFYYTIFYFAYDIPKEYILTMTHAPQCSFLWFRYLTPWGRRSVLRSSESRGTVSGNIFWRSILAFLIYEKLLKNWLSKKVVHFQKWVWHKKSVCGHAWWMKNLKRSEIQQSTI